MCILGLDKKPCQGKAVQTKPCNLHACPAVGPSKDDAVVLPLIVKSMRASSRPQREEPCIIKEGDLELVRDDLLGFKVPPRTAARVVLNNSTFSIFATDNFEDILFSCTLKELQLEPDVADINCFKIINKRSMKTKTLCALALNRESMADQVKSWKKNIALFQTKCQNEMVALRTKKPPMLDPVVAAKQRSLDNTRMAMKSEEETPDPTAEVTEGFKGIQDNLVSALSKEMKFEQLVE